MSRMDGNYSMDEYIKKIDAIHALCKTVHKDDDEIPCENQVISCLWNKTRVCDYAREIDALQPADVRPVRRGHWIHDGFDNPHGVDWMHCSECGKRDVYCPAAMTNYCPSCGAYMREVSNESD